MIEAESRSAFGGALRNLIGGGVIATAAALAPAAAWALDPLGNAQVSFRADITVTADGTRHRGRLYHRHGMQRHEFPGQGITRILRFDLNRMWTINHRTKTYTEAVLEGLGTHAGVFDRRRLGSELEHSVTVGRERIDRHRVHGMTTDRTQIEGEAWMTQDGILFRLNLKMRFVGVRYDYRMEMRGLRRMAIDQALFDVPVGYRHVSLTPRWLPPPTDAIAGAVPKGAAPVDRMVPAGSPGRPSRPTSTTSRAPGKKNPYSLEQIFKDGTTSRK